MKEIEAKILEIDRKSLEKKLRAYGAKKVFDGPVDVRYFDCSGLLIKKGIILRLRRKGPSGELTVKTDFQRTVHAKISSEHETAVDFATMRDILHLLGYTESWRMKKHRIEYACGAVHFEIDKISGIPWFLEIEAPNERQLLVWIKKLGYTRKDAKNWWWHEVLAYYEYRKKQKH